MPILREDIQRFLNKEWDINWNAVLDGIINAVQDYFKAWFGWKWEAVVQGEKVHFKNYVAVASNPIKQLTAVKDKAGNAYDLTTFLVSDFLIYDEEFRFANDDLYIDYVSIDIPDAIKQELIIVIASLFNRMYSEGFDKDARIMDGGGFRINERYIDVFEEAKKRLQIYQKRIW